MVHREAGYLSVVWRQSKLLLRKNWILSKRNRRSTILQLVVPLFFVALLWLLQIGLRSNAQYSSFTKLVEKSTIIPFDSVPRCSGADCITLGYVSGSPDTTEVILKMADLSGIPQNELKSFGNASDMDDFLSSNPGGLQIGVLMNNVNRGGKNVYEYSIQYNKTITYVSGQAVNTMYKLVIPYAKAIERTLVAHVTDNANESAFDFEVASYPHPELLNVDVIGQNGPSFFFGALMFNVVIQLGQIVNEKELKLREGMNIMGLKDSVFWLTWFITNSIFNTLSVLVLIAGGYIFQFDFFLKNSILLVFFLFFLFGLAMVPFVFLMSTIVSKSQTATSLGFVVFLVGIIMQAFAGLLYSNIVSKIWRILFSFLPFVLLSKGISDLSNASSGALSSGMKWSQRFDGFFPMNDLYTWYIIDFCVLLVAALYLDQVLPGAAASKQPVWFFLLPSYWFGSRKGSKAFVPAPPIQDADADVAEHRRQVLVNDLPNTTAVKIVNLCKTYQLQGRPVNAVNHTCLAIQSGELMCVLGHNGAGKTTTISMLTGLIKPTSGDATIFGHSIIDSMDIIRKQMGVCPQHDILWDDLTGREHLQLFAGLKELDGAARTAEVEARLRDIDLVKAANTPTRGYSGGMKRRLSTAIALIGDPKIVFLDEPTTGMDPVSRRQVWNLIEQVKNTRVIVLTTHSMEEADMLADNIVIMKHGNYACIGTSLRLKNKFGAGYRVVVLLDEGRKAEVATFFKNNLGLNPSSGALGLLEYNIPRDLLPNLHTFFEKLEPMQQSLGIKDLQLSLTTLEEVFLRIAGEYETL